MLSQFDIGWLVGLIEGDGCFTFDGRYPAVALKITDLDVAERFGRLMGGAAVCGPYHYEGGQLGDKPYWSTRLSGPRARQFMASTAHHFSERRQEQIAKLLGHQMALDVDHHSPADEPSENVPRGTVSYVHQLAMQLNTNEEKQHVR